MHGLRRPRQEAIAVRRAITRCHSRASRRNRWPNLTRSRRNTGTQRNWRSLPRERRRHKSGVARD